METWKNRVDNALWQSVREGAAISSPVSMMCTYLLSLKKMRRRYNTIENNQQQYSDCVSHFIEKKRLFTEKGVSYDGVMNFLAPVGNEVQLFDLFIYSLYLSTHPNHVFYLKMHIDLATQCIPHSSCFTNKRLIFDYLANLVYRDDILLHIQAGSGTKKLLHILTDIDDTVYPSSLGGTDLTFKSKVFFPGVFAFHQLVDNSNMTTFLSARPNLGKLNLIPVKPVDMSDSGQRAHFLDEFKARKWPHRPHMMLGESASFFKTLPSASRDFLGRYYRNFTATPDTIADILKLGQELEPDMCNVDNNMLLDRYVSDSEWANAYRHFGIDKFRSFCQLAQIYPEYRFIFIGDTGQGDMLSALLMSHHPSMVASLIRQVIRHKNPYESLVSEELKSELASKNVFLFSNYIESALLLYKMGQGIVSKTKVKEIAISAHQDFYGRDGDHSGSHMKMYEVHPAAESYVGMNIKKHYEEAKVL